MITENTLRTKIEVTSDGRLTAALEATAQGVEKVDKAQQAQADSATAAATAGQANATATQALGESAAEAEARIKAMVQASLARQQAEQAQITSSMRSVAATKVATQSVQDQITAHQRAVGAADAYRASSAAASKAAGNTSGLDAQRTAMHQLLGEIDPTVTALGKLDQQQAKLAGFKKAGLLSDDDFARFNQAIDGSRNRITAAGEAMSHFSLNTAQSRRELGYLVKDLATGQYGRLSQTSLTLANASGLLSLALSGVGVAVAATAGVFVGFAAAALQVYEEEQKLNKAIALTGDYAGQTMGDINRLAASMAAAGTGKARDAMLALVGTGTVGRESFEAMGKAAVNMSLLTGGSADQAAASVVKMFDGTVAGAMRANEQYHFLNASVVDHIHALEEVGDKQGAMKVAAEAFTTATTPRIQTMAEQTYGLASAWEEASKNIGTAWENFKGYASVKIGTAGEQAQLDAVNARLTSPQSLVDKFIHPRQDDMAERDRLQAIIDQRQSDARRDAAATMRSDAGAQGDNALNAIIKAGRDNEQKRADELIAAHKAANDAIRDARARNDDALVASIREKETKSVAIINAKYAPPKGPRTRNPEPAAYATFTNQVDALGIKNITADDAALAQYQQGIAKLAEDMSNYMAKGGDATKAAAEFNRGQQALQKTLDTNHAREIAAQNQYADALNKSNAALQQQVNNEIARIGMGDKEYQRSQAITKAYQEEADALEKLSLKRQAGINGESGGLSQASYDADVRALRAATAAKVQIMQDGYARMDEAQGNWLNGVTSSMQNFVDAAKDVAGTVRDGFAGMYGDMENDAVDWASGSSLSMNNVEKDFERMLARMVFRALAAQATTALLGLFAPMSTAGGYNSASSADQVAYDVSQAGSGYAGGGRIAAPGTGTSDSGLARVSNGENVITAKATDYYGQAFMDNLNAMRLPRFADGGRVGGGSGAPAAPGTSLPPIVNIYGAENGGRAEASQNRDGQWVISAFINAAAQDVARNGPLGQAVNAVTGTRRPARSYATPPGN